MKGGEMKGGEMRGGGTRGGEEVRRAGLILGVSGVRLPLAGTILRLRAMENALVSHQKRPEIEDMPINLSVFVDAGIAASFLKGEVDGWVGMERTLPENESTVEQTTSLVFGFLSREGWQRHTVYAMISARPCRWVRVLTRG